MTEDCSICFEPLWETGKGTVVRYLACTHKFHEPCLNRWVRRSKNTCPLCRQRFTLSRTTTQREVVYRQDCSCHPYLTIFLAIISLIAISLSIIALCIAVGDKKDL